MPAITRWFKVSNDINSDPEVWELTDTFGDRALRVWIEMLSIADRNRGVVGPDSDHSRIAIASKSRMSRVKVRLIFDWCLTKVWLVSDNGLRVAKWSKYNKTRDDDKIPVGKRPSPLLDTPRQSETLQLKDKSPNLEIEIPDWIPLQPWEAYLKHRKHKRAKVTPEAAHGLIEKLLEFKKQGEDVSAILKQSVTNGWTGLFPVGQGKGNGKPPLATSQVPAYKPRPAEPRPTKEQQAKLKVMLQELTEKIGNG